MKDAGIFQRQKIELLTPGAALLADSASAATSASSPTYPLSPPPAPVPSLLCSSTASSPQLQPPRASSPPPSSRPPSSSRPELAPPLPRSASLGNPRQDEQARQHVGLGGGHAHASIIIHKLDSSPPLAQCIWDGAGGLHLKPDPSMVISQFAIYSISNFLLLTVSQDFIDTQEGSNCHSRSGSDSGGEEGASGQEAPASHPWEELKERIRSADADVRVNSSSAKYLTFCAMVSSFVCCLDLIS